MGASTIVNKVPYDFYSMEFELAVDGENGAAGESFGIVEGVEEIDYSVKINREDMRGTSRVPLDQTDGDAEFDASITMLRSWYDFIVARAHSLGIGLAMLRMTMTITYGHKGEVLHTDTLKRVKLAEIGNSHKRGPEALMVSLPLDLENIYYDGVDVFGSKLAA